jgi:fused signal recognition particle receptor
MAFQWFKKKNKSEKAAGKSSEVDSAIPSREETPSQNNVTPEPPRIDDAPDTTPPEPVTIVENDSTETLSTQHSGLFARLKRGLTKTRAILNTDIEDLFRGKKHIDDAMLEEIEELLITSDIGIQTTMALMNTVARKAARIESPEALKQVLRQEILALFDSISPPAKPASRHKPNVVMVVGVNGVGKTTTIGKLAAKKVNEGHKVLIAAADTFRAAAVEQLAIWADKAGADIVRHKDNADPAAVAYDSIDAALARKIDTVFIDTAGRLHTKVNLMEELKKIQRSIGKKLPEAPHEVLLVLDATTGQNAIAQAKMFHESIGVTGLALTKLDGTAKGGIVISICQQLNLPLHYIGVGEAIEDLQTFDANTFINALF